LRDDRRTAAGGAKVSAAPRGHARLDGDPTGFFAEDFVQRLGHLELAMRRGRASGRAGQRSTRRPGRGLEFSDHRAYVPGDDIRHFDWNLYARLGRPMVRLFQEETDLGVHILVDRSASMAAGQPSKLVLALRLAAALSLVGQGGGDHVSIMTTSDVLRDLSRPGATTAQLMTTLAGVTAGGRTDLAASLKAFLSRRPRRGLVFLLSDFFDAHPPEAALGWLGRHGFDAVVLVIAAPEEIEPTLDEALAGDVVLVDAETGEERRLSITPALLGAYRARVTARQQALSELCRARGIPCFHVLSNARFDDVVLRVLRAGGVVV
jgi:uncharacterized protein (DUF58 family)